MLNLNLMSIGSTTFQRFPQHFMWSGCFGLSEVCNVGSKIRSLKCFEYKLEAQTVEIADDVDEWIAKIK